jgi:putative membrane protein insertion efficiency factor
MLPADLSLAQRIALGLLRSYRVMFSSMYAGSCRFHPSCSEYAAEAVARFGVVRGCFLAARRLARCNPFGASGLDQVPSARGESR